MSERLILIFTSDVFYIDVNLQAELYDEFYHLVYDMVLYIVQDHAAAEDVIQESFIKVLKNHPRYVDEKQIKGWLRTVTRNTALNFLRKNKKMRDELQTKDVYIEEGLDIFQQSPSVEQQVEGKLFWESLLNEINLLKPQYRKVMELKYVHELTYKEMAEVIGITEGAVRQRLARAKDILKKRWGAQ